MKSPEDLLYNNVIKIDENLHNPILDSDLLNKILKRSSNLNCEFETHKHKKHEVNVDLSVCDDLRHEYEILEDPKYYGMTDADSLTETEANITDIKNSFTIPFRSNDIDGNLYGIAYYRYNSMVLSIDDSRGILLDCLQNSIMNWVTENGFKIKDINFYSQTIMRTN